MKFKLKDYHISYKKDLDRALKAYPSRDRFDTVAQVSASTGCHIIALLYFLMELKGPDELTLNKILDMKKF